MKKLTHSESEIVKSVNELEVSQLKKLKELEEDLPRTIPKSRLRYGRRPRLPTIYFT